MKHRNSVVSWCVVFTIVLSMGMASQHVYADNTEGQLTVAGDTVQLQHAYAFAGPDPVDASQEVVVLIVANMPLSDEAVEDKWVRREMATEGVLKAVEVPINPEELKGGRLPNVTILHSAFEMIPNVSSTEHILEFKTFDEKNVEGRMYCRSELSSFDTPYTFDFTFAAEIRRKEKLPPPTEAEKEAAVKSPQAAVYLEFIKAAHTGDVDGLKKVLAAEVAQELDGPDKEDMLEFLKLFTPKDVEFQRILEEDDESVTLILSAQEEGQALEGTIEFIKEGETWRVLMSNWE